MLRNTSAFRNSLIVALLFLLASGSAFAQATRTWVSGVGNDAAPCSRTAPCKTFAGAISKTAAGGIINCIDPGGFGTVTITKSITISCKHVEGSALASGTTGVIVNAAGINVVLRGLDIDGGAPALLGVNGIRFLQGASLLVEDCTIRDFNSASPNGNGILVNNTSGSVRLDVVDSHITGNGAGNGTTGGAGVLVVPTGTGSADVSIRNSNLAGNVNGVRADSTSTTGTIDVVITNSAVSHGTGFGVTAIAPTTAVRVMFQGVTVDHNDQGVRSVGAQAVIRLGSSVITANNFGLQTASSGQIQSYSNNQINGNTADGGVTLVALK